MRAPEVSLRIVRSVDHAIDLFNRYSPQFAASLISEEGSSRSTRREQVRERLAELWSYLIANQTRLINYGREYRKGAIAYRHREWSRLWTSW